MTYLCLKFALDALELVVSVDVVAEGDSRVRGEGAQVAVVDLGVIYIVIILIPSVIKASSSSLS